MRNLSSHITREIRVRAEIRMTNLGEVIDRQHGQCVLMEMSVNKPTSFHSPTVPHDSDITFCVLCLQLFGTKQVKGDIPNWKENTKPVYFFKIHVCYLNRFSVQYISWDWLKRWSRSYSSPSHTSTRKLINNAYLTSFLPNTVITVW